MLLESAHVLHMWACMPLACGLFYAVHELLDVELALAAVVVHEAYLAKDLALSPALRDTASSHQYCCGSCNNAAASSMHSSHHTWAQPMTPHHTNIRCTELPPDADMPEHSLPWPSCSSDTTTWSAQHTRASYIWHLVMNAPHAPDAAHIAIGVPPINLPLVVQTDRKVQGLLRRLRPLQNLRAARHDWAGLAAPACLHSGSQRSWHARQAAGRRVLA